MNKQTAISFPYRPEVPTSLALSFSTDEQEFYLKLFKFHNNPRVFNIDGTCREIKPYHDEYRTPVDGLRRSYFYGLAHKAPSGKYICQSFAFDIDSKKFDSSAVAKARMLSIVGKLKAIGLEPYTAISSLTKEPLYSYAGYHIYVLFDRPHSYAALVRAFEAYLGSELDRVEYKFGVHAIRPCFISKGERRLAGFFLEQGSERSPEQLIRSYGKPRKRPVREVEERKKVIGSAIEITEHGQRHYRLLELARQVLGADKEKNRDAYLQAAQSLYQNAKVQLTASLEEHLQEAERIYSHYDPDKAFNLLAFVSTLPRNLTPIEFRDAIFETGKNTVTHKMISLYYGVPKGRATYKLLEQMDLEVVKQGGKYLGDATLYRKGKAYVSETAIVTFGSTATCTLRATKLHAIEKDSTSSRRHNKDNSVPRGSRTRHRANRKKADSS